MVDVSTKPAAARRAVASGTIRLCRATLELIRTGKTAKGDVLTTAKLAGITAAKHASLLIPLCHPIRLDAVEIAFEFVRGGIRITAEVKARDCTGVEMEALTAVALAALTIYDMVKAVDRGAVIGEIMLVEKQGGESGHFRRSKKRD